MSKLIKIFIYNILHFIIFYFFRINLMLDQMFQSGKRTIPLIYIIAIGFFVFMITLYDTIQSQIDKYNINKSLISEISGGPKVPKQ